MQIAVLAVLPERTMGVDALDEVPDGLRHVGRNVIVAHL
jgi:hypothetical protein